MVPLSRRSVLPRIRMNMRALAQLLSSGGTMAYCFALGSRGRAFARGMLPWGMLEDPATGSAGGSLGAYLVQHGHLRPSETLKIMQGVEMGRPSEIQVEISEERGGRLTPKVSGSAVRVFEGEIEA
jgi:trans-2,3-dihydro-3-hydroxyanthranilate isomerase